MDDTLKQLLAVAADRAEEVGDQIAVFLRDLSRTGTTLDIPNVRMVAWQNLEDRTTTLEAKATIALMATRSVTISDREIRSVRHDDDLHELWDQHHDELIAKLGLTGQAYSRDSFTTDGVTVPSRRR